MIRAHVLGVRALERWAMEALAAMLDTRTSSVPEDLLRVAKECKTLMW